MQDVLKPPAVSCDSRCAAPAGEAHHMGTLCLAGSKVPGFWRKGKCPAHTLVCTSSPGTVNPSPQGLAGMPQSQAPDANLGCPARGPLYDTASGPFCTGPWAGRDLTIDLPKGPRAIRGGCQCGHHSKAGAFGTMFHGRRYGQIGQFHYF